MTSTPEAAENQKRITHPLYNLLPVNISGFDKLATLALDMRWSWNHASDCLWRKLDEELWEITHNPWVVLQTVAHERIEAVMGDPEYRRQVDELLAIQQQTLNSPAWFQHQYAASSLKCIAYFSMEFMLSDALPIYSGGLGNVAGDQLKAASDLGVPVVGVGLLYQQGYFRQVIDKDGLQQALYPYNDPGQLPITPLRTASGDLLRLKVTLSGHPVWLRSWQVQVGRVKLYLLDTNDSANIPAHRGITSELYGGGPELRLQQELLLGMGGWRLLEALGIQPEVCHLNEGHAAFLVLERARHFMLQNNQPFDVALTATRVGNVFTTHTAVSAGFDRFAPSLIEQYLNVYVTKLGISLQDLLALGRQNPHDQNEDFNMAYLAIRGSSHVNGVSQLHAKVSRHLFEPLFPRWPHSEVPIGHITNGVHMPTWDSAAADELWTQACSKERWLNATNSMETNIRKVSDEKLWQFRNTNRQLLVNFAGTRLTRQLTGSGLPPEELAEIPNILNPNILTLGFARRFAAYKRTNLLLQDPARLLRILTNAERPVQLIIAGKAHPMDLQGQALIHQWIKFIRQPEVRKHIVFLSDYDMWLSEQLVQGVDVWINTPRRPWEASGTSGMKVLVNGGLNLSELDGWWVEAYSPELGWALGDGNEHGDDPAWDATEANALYEILEQQVIPEFYERDPQGMPRNWLNRIRESMAQLTPRFSANRTVSEYTEQLYLPAADAFLKRTANQGEKAQQILAWGKNLNEHWGSLGFGEIQITTNDNQHHFEVEVYLHYLEPSTISVEIYAEAEASSVATRQLMQTDGSTPQDSNAPTLYRASVPDNRPASDFTLRIIPYFEDVAIPQEIQHIFWQD